MLNSLDAKSTAIAVRLNFITFRIQVVDNGDGIMKDNLNLIGQRYVTSKCNHLDQLDSHCAYYGFRGEALASIINIAKTVEITSKPRNTSDTWSKSFAEGARNNIISVKDRPSYGTTITIEDFLYNLPLRKKRVIPEVELDHIKRNIEALIIMHPNVSFSLRNDVTGDLILNNQKCENIVSSFKYLHPEIKSEYSLIKVSKNNVTIKGLLFKEMFENNNLQYIYVNKRPVKCSKIQIFINNAFLRNKKYTKEVFHLNPVNEKIKHYIYIINIKCPHSSVDILLSSTKTVVEFKNWNIILSCIEKLVLSFLGCNEKVIKENFARPCKALKSDCGISQINGVFKSYGVKRKSSSKKTELSSRKKQKLTSTQNIEENSLKELSQHLANNYVPNNVAFVKRKIKKTKPHKQLRNKKPSQNIDLLKNTNNISEFSCEYKGEGITDIDKPKNVTNILSDNNNYLQKFAVPVRQISPKSIHPLPIKIFNKDNYQNFNSGKINISHVLENNWHNFISTKVDISHRIESKSNRINKTDNSAISNTRISREFNVHMQPDEKSFLTKFTNDENKGKNLIMDMFLKSTQVYNSDDEYQNDKKSENTVFEVESNYFLENNVTTNINGKSKTMSVSINITKKIKKKCNVNKKLHTASKLVQTSLENKMIARSVQTSLHQERDNDNNYVISSDDIRMAENYTIILSRTNREPPRFRFIRQMPCSVAYVEPITPVQENYCICNCHKNVDKIFNFDIKTTHNNFKFFGSPIQIYRGNYTEQNDCGLTENITMHKRDYFRKKLDGNKLSKNRKQFEANEMSQKSINEHFYNKMNPYPFDSDYQKEPNKCNLNLDFKDNTILSMLPNTDKKYELFNPQYQSTQMNDFFRMKYYDKKIRQNDTGYITPQKGLQQCNGTYSKICGKYNDPISNISISKHTNNNNYAMRDTHVHPLNDFTGDHNKDFKYIDTNPENIISDKMANSNLNSKGRSEKENDIVFLHNPSSAHQKITNAQKTKTTQDCEEELFITLSNRQKQEILENELNTEKQLCNKINLEWESQMALSKEKEDAKQNRSEEFGQDWVKKQNNFGSNFYVNKRTGN